MAQTDTITRNAVQELMELPVAREPLTVEIELPTGREIKVQAAAQALLDKLDAMSPDEWKRVWQGTWDHVRTPPVRAHRVTRYEMSHSVPSPYAYYGHGAVTCMPSRNPLLWGYRLREGDVRGEDG